MILCNGQKQKKSCSYLTRCQNNDIVISYKVAAWQLESRITRDEKDSRVTRDMWINSSFSSVMIEDYFSLVSHVKSMNQESTQK